PAVAGPPAPGTAGLPAAGESPGDEGDPAGDDPADREACGDWEADAAARAGCEPRAEAWPRVPADAAWSAGRAGALTADSPPAEDGAPGADALPAGGLACPPGPGAWAAPAPVPVTV